MRRHTLLAALAALLATGCVGTETVEELPAPAPAPSIPAAAFVPVAATTARLPSRISPAELLDALERRGCPIGSLEYVEGRLKSGIKITCASPVGNFWKLAD